MRQGDFKHFAAVSLLKADPVKLRTVTDWFNWSEQYGAIQPIRQVIQGVWKRVREDSKCSLDSKLRWLEHTREYFTALGKSIDFEPRPSLQETIAGFMEYHIHTFAMLSLFSFVERAADPNAVFQNQAIMQLEQISIEIQISFFANSEQHSPPSTPAHRLQRQRLRLLSQGKGPKLPLQHNPPPPPLRLLLTGGLR
ncbi:uncharacterized protein L3040_008436 [Drepanopeziza brunnea f. sp. 'multigermtubi']|uniref:uncharacterized protein n=1 Tax=Drepanopeziza brunnea f. sp. 'multigermtubi' TaxID=698441 RepID=UPI0023A21388|nr:hypothetical protein L3040_008436 [Drepanopeziza brunnea f. sp. 'multigermtubi']